MKNRKFRFAGLAVIVLLCSMLLIVLIPRKYNVPEYQIRPGTRFWHLSDGSGIAYTLIPARGLKTSTPVIFLQGGPGGPIYDRNIELLSPLAGNGFDVYLYDQLGCGASSRLEHIKDYTVDRHKRDLEEIVNLLGSPKVILIGQSWGAMLAAAFIADHPDRVEKVVFTGPGPILPWNRNLENIKAPDSLELTNPVYTNKQGKKKIYNLRAGFVEFCATKLNIKLASDKEMDAFSTLLNHEMGKSTVCNPGALVLDDKIEPGSGYYSMVKTAQSFQEVSDIRSGLKDCPVPALIMRGQCDGIKWGYITDYLNLFTNHQLVIIPGAGHSIGREQPEIYTETIRDFLR